MSAQLTVADTGTRGELVERRGAVAMTPMDMVNQAVANGASIDVLTKLMDLHERWEAGQARKAFDEAIGAAKADMPTITKNKQVGFESARGGSKTSYRHETLDEIARVVTPVLAQHGLSYRFRVTSEPNQPVRVTCIVSHQGGHSEETTLSGGADNSGNKNSLQAIGSAITYLQRYSLKAALGLAASDDDDGMAASPRSSVDEDGDEVISPEQASQLRTLADEVGADVRRFCAYLRTPSLAQLPVGQFDRAVKALEAKRGRA